MGGQDLSGHLPGPGDRVGPAGLDPGGVGPAVEEARIPDLAPVPGRVRRLQEVSARPHLVNHLQGQRLRGNFHPPEQPPHQADDLIADDDHLVGAGQAGLDIAHIVDQVGPGEGRPEDPERALDPGLKVRPFGIGAAGKAPDREAVVVVGQFGHGHAVEHEFGAGIDADHGTHVERAAPRAPDEGGARPAQLGDDQAAQHLGAGHRQAAGRGDRGGGSFQGARRVNKGQPPVGHAKQLAQGGLGMAERRGRLQIGQEKGPKGQFLRPAGHRLGHGQDVGQAVFVPGGEHDGLDRVLQHGQEGVAVRGLGRDIGGQGHGHDEIQIGQGIHQAGGIPHIGEAGGPAFARLQVQGVRQVGAGAKVAAMSLQEGVRFAGAVAEDHPGGGLSQRLLDDGGGEAHQGPVRHRTAGLLEQPAGLRIVHPHAGAAEDLQGRQVNLLQLGIVEQTVAGGPGWGRFQRPVWVGHERKPPAERRRPGSAGQGMGRRHQGIDEARVRVRREGAARAHHKAPRPGADGRLPAHLGGHLLHRAVQAEADGVDVPQDGGPAGHPLDHLRQFDAERLFALLHGDGIHLQAGDALQAGDDVAADVMDGEDSQGTQVVEVGLVVGEDEFIVTARRNHIRPGKDLLHIDPVNSHVRPGGHLLLGSPELALQETVEQFRAVVLDEHKPLEAQQVVGAGEGGVQHGGEEIAFAVVGHHLTGQVEIAPGQQFLALQEGQAGFHLLQVAPFGREVPKVAPGSIRRGRQPIATGEGDLVHRHLGSGQAVPVAERSVLAADDFGALGPGAAGAPVDLHPVRPHLEDAVGLVERLGPKAGILLVDDRVDRTAAHPAAVEFDVIGAFEIGQEEAQVGRRGGEHVHRFPPERPAHPVDGEQGGGSHGQLLVRTASTCSKAQSNSSLVTTRGGARRMTCSWVSLQSMPRSWSASQKRRAPPASALSSMPTSNPLPRTSRIYSLSRRESRPRR